MKSQLSTKKKIAKKENKAVKTNTFCIKREIKI